MKCLGLWSAGLRNFFEKFVKPSGPPPTYFMYAPLYTYSHIHFITTKNGQLFMNLHMETTFDTFQHGSKPQEQPQ